MPIEFSNLSPIFDTVTSSLLTFDAPASATTMNITFGPYNTTEINDGGTGAFELIDFANKTEVTASINNPGATSTIGITDGAAGLTTLNINSKAGSDTVDVVAAPHAVATNIDMGAGSGSTTNIGDSGTLSSIDGDVYVKSSGGSNTLAVDDSDDGPGNTYTIANSQVTASTLGTFINFAGGGITTLDLDGQGQGDTFDFTGPVQTDVKTFNFTDGSGSGPNTLNVTSSVSALDYATAGVLSFGAGEPVVNYSNFTTVNVSKVAAAPVGTARTISATQGLPFTQAVVATFTDGDLDVTAGTFVASINWGDGTPTSGGSIVANGTTSFDIQGSHTYAEPGTYTVDVTLTALNSSGSTTVSGTLIHVASTGPVNSATNPIASTADVAPSQLPANSVENLTGLAISADQDVEFTQAVATFTDTSSAAVASQFLASINWGDGSAVAVGTISENASNTFFVTGTHTYTKAGSFTPIVTIKDPYGALYATGSFNQTNLVSSVNGLAAVIDSSLINPWGMSSSSTSPIWVSDKGARCRPCTTPTAIRSSKGSRSRSRRPAHRQAQPARSSTVTRRRPTSTFRGQVERFVPYLFSLRSTARSLAGTPGPMEARRRR